MTTQDWNRADVAQKWDAAGDRNNPTRREQLDILVRVIAEHYQAGHWLIDLGYGSGKVEHLLFERIPEAMVVGIDSSTEMMRLAEERLIAYQDRFVPIEHDLNALETALLPDHRYQFAIGIQSLHHLSPERMQAAFQFVYRMLEPGGMFLVLDRTKVVTDALWDVYQAVWSRQDEVYGSVVLPHEGEDFEDHERIVRARGDFPVTHEELLQWLRGAGFDAACLHLHANRALIVGKKPNRRPEPAGIT